MVKNLKKLRCEAHISQQTLASAIGVSQQSINKYENHNIEPDIATLISLADYFDTTIDYLVGKTDQYGHNENLTENDEFMSRFKTLDKKEKFCVKALVDAFYHTKNTEKH